MNIVLSELVTSKFDSEIILSNFTQRIE